MHRLADLDDPQAALLLLRHCASYCKLAYSARVVPPSAHQQALQDFDMDVRRTFEATTAMFPDDDAWGRAQLGTAMGGLGLRSAHRHADAAYVASVVESASLATAVDTAFDMLNGGTASCVSQAVRALNAKLPQPAHVQLGDVSGVSQRAVSRKLERAALDATLASPATPQHVKAHLQLVSVEGAGMVFHAPPSKNLGTWMDGDLYKVVLQRRLRMPLWPEACHCTACGAAMDIWGDHALSCGCRGDRTLRHNALRDVTYHAALAAGLQPQREKSGLLPQRPGQDALRENVLSNGRRPADVWIPRWENGAPAAWDFAVTSGLRAGAVHEAAADPSQPVTAYEAHKRAHLGTAAQCHQQGLSFVPMVVEAHGGGWGPAAKGVWRFLARAKAAQTGQDESATAQELAQRIGITLHRESARAILRRVPPTSDARVDASPEAWDDHEADTDTDT